MSQTQVVQILGDSYSAGHNRDGSETWFYGSDYELLFVEFSSAGILDNWWFKD